MKRKILKILLGIISFIIGGIIAVLILGSFNVNRTFSNMLQLIIHIGLAILIYRLSVKYLFKNPEKIEN